MNKDFANSFEQRRWEYALDGYQRCLLVLSKYGHMDEKYLNYWRNRKIELEKEYQTLGKQ